ncbi:hypothetical protein [Mycobacterium simulans]|uniref:hypothetical protein n=1 Tax=Mycobacterium simulans TaxID=627089 RepID=UPI00174E101C|nr:hypothetical protein [Mycobacterium simulans]
MEDIPLQRIYAPAYHPDDPTAPAKRRRRRARFAEQLTRSHVVVYPAGEYS